MGTRLTGTIAGATVAALLTSAQALAGIEGPTVSLGKSKGLEYRKATFTDVVSQVAQPVTCDGDSEATGGGGVVGGATVDAELNGSYPMTPGPSGWTVEGSAAAAQDVTGFAICAGADTGVVTASDDVPADSSITQVAFCPSDPGVVVTGGGIEASGADIRIGTTYPPELQNDNWFGLATNTSGGQLEVLYHAVCTDAFVVKYRNSDVIKVKPGESAKATASCRPKEAVLGGGFLGFRDGLPAAGGWAAASKPKDSKQDKKKVPDDAWQAKYHNDSVVTHRLLVRATCKKGDAP